MEFYVLKPIRIGYLKEELALTWKRFSIIEVKIFPCTRPKKLARAMKNSEAQIDSESIPQNRQSLSQELTEQLTVSWHTFGEAEAYVCIHKTRFHAAPNIIFYQSPLPLPSDQFKLMGGLATLLISEPNSSRPLRDSFIIWGDSCGQTKALFKFAFLGGHKAPQSLPNGQCPQPIPRQPIPPSDIKIWSLSTQTIP